MVLWGSDIGKQETDVSYQIENAAVRFYQDLKYLALGDSTISKINDAGNVSTDNSNLEMSSSSTKGDIVGVVYADEYKCCIAKVHPITDVGECTKCSMKVKLSRCETSTSARVKLVIRRESLYLAKLYEQLLVEKNLITSC